MASIEMIWKATKRHIFSSTVFNSFTYKFGIHLIAWTALYVLAVMFLYSNNSNLGETILSTGILFLTQIAIFYLNSNVYLPKFFDQKKYVLYILIVLGTVIFFLTLLYLNRSFLPGELELRKLSIQKPIREGGHRLGRLIFQGIGMFGTLFLSTIYRNISQKKKKDQQRIYLENRILEAESKMLKSQLNPHFLFNALNNIYALAQVQSEKTPESIHRLSQILRYILYDSETEKVLLSQDLKYIESFVELQLLKDENLDNIHLNIHSINPKLKIAPLILISFIENCFKHSYFESSNEHWIKIQISAEGQRLHFNASNSIPKQELRKDKVGGVGLSNVKKRLELLYPNKHELNIRTDKHIYNVNLTIELDEI